MALYRLGPVLAFPDPMEAEPDGLIAVGGDLSVGRLKAAYLAGIYPWYSEGDPILWWSPDPRMVLFPSEMHVPRSLRKRMRTGAFEMRWNTAFTAVVEACANAPRPDQEGTWITASMREAYGAFHEAGYAMSVEAWIDDALVAGLYGVSMGRCFFGESMYTLVPDASKACLVELVERLGSLGVEMIDCQMYTEHLARFGAREITRREFLGHVRAHCDEGRPLQSVNG